MKPPPSIHEMKSTYLNLIADIDKTLDMLRLLWLEAEPMAKAKYWIRIDSILDERLRIMKLRDAEPIST